MRMREKKAVDDIRQQALIRAEQLSRDALSYMREAEAVETGLTTYERAEVRKQQILDYLGGSLQDWDDWRWQLKNRIKDAGVLADILGMGEVEKKRVEKVGKLFRWAISPYYLSLVPDDYHDNPIFRQAVPDIRELDEGGSLDPMNEAMTSPAPCVTRRYPDRLIINVTNQCAMFCRHCQRRRNIGEKDHHAKSSDISEAIAYVAENREIRDVLITGGDALLLSDQYLDWILGELHRIPHVEIKRIGTRTPVTLPQRVTPELCEVLRRYPPIYINTQFNHPLEVTPEARDACSRLAEAGVVLGNQAVLLKGINDSPTIMRKLNHELLRIRVRPYYIFHAKDVRGTRHWQTSICTGLSIMESLRGHTSGLAVPTYILNAPGGYGKIPVMPNYILDMQEDVVTLRTWEGRVFEVYNEPPGNEEELVPGQDEMTG
ncbi:MAG: glutamate 2,3-aminomutase [Syntrophomonadaceae bacterium]|nr:glutamate 2,3-aminomutase [Syntrophomonadaceae bacterium]